MIVITNPSNWIGGFEVMWPCLWITSVLLGYQVSAFSDLAGWVGSWLALEW